MDEEDQPEPIAVISDNGEICIYTATELTYIGIYTTYPLSSNYILMNDITLSDEWTPIGNSSLNYFRWVLNSNFSLQNLGQEPITS